MYVITVKGNEIERALKIIKKRKRSVEEMALKIVTDDAQIVAALKGAGIEIEAVKIKAL